MGVPDEAMIRLRQGNTHCITAAGWISWIDGLSRPRNPKSFRGQTEQDVRLVLSWAVCWAIGKKAIGTPGSRAYAIDVERHGMSTSRPTICSPKL